jgi:NhaA family Na+:H+ antiporter
MLKTVLRRSTLAITDKLSGSVRLLIKDEAASGKLLLVGIVIALIAMNTPFRDEYERFWAQLFTIDIGGWGISETLRHWVDEGLMAIFFLVAGLEIKREIVRGELQTWRAASLPIAAALGGMLVPALFYVAFNHGQEGFPGWGVPITTDTAFALGALALLGRRIHPSLRLFLLALVVIDDIGAITVISLFYSEAVDVAWLAAAAGVLIVIGVLQWMRLLRFTVFIGLGIALWLCMHASGVHAAIAGALLGLSAPIVSRRRDKRAIAGRLERALIPISAFVVMPLFALANAGVQIRADVFSSEAAMMVGAGVVSGLVLGKVIGITLATWLVVRTRLVGLPEGVNWKMISGAGMIAGIGFTLSIFIAELAFHGSELIEAAKVSILIASVVSAVAGLAWLWWASRPPQNDPERL